MEYLDIINKNDDIIGQNNRDIIHKQGLLHREIHVWFLDEKNNIIFQKRGIRKSSGGLLDATVGGHVDSGEDYIKTAIRETKEEIGINIKREDLILIKKYNEYYIDNKTKDINNFMRTVFLSKKIINTQEIIREQENFGVDFISLSVNQIKQTDQKKFDTYILKEVEEFLKII